MATTQRKTQQNKLHVMQVIGLYMWLGFAIYKTELNLHIGVLTLANVKTVGAGIKSCAFFQVLGNYINAGPQRPPPTLGPIFALLLPKNNKP